MVCPVRRGPVALEPFILQQGQRLLLGVWSHEWHGDFKHALDARARGLEGDAHRGMPQYVGTIAVPLSASLPASRSCCAIADQYAELAKNRPQDICVHAAICSDFEQMHWISKGGVGGAIVFLWDKLPRRRPPA